MILIVSWFCNKTENLVKCDVHDKCYEPYWAWPIMLDDKHELLHVDYAIWASLKKMSP